MKAGSGRRRQRGFTYLGALFLVMLLGLGLAGSLQAWSLVNQRAREQELLWVGNQYVRALNAYYQQSPGSPQYPQHLEELLEDKRFPVPRHHLRRLYPDPITRNNDWGLVRTPDGRIAGVYSRSDAVPWKQSNFPLRWQAFNNKTKYSEWRFMGDAAVAAEKQAAAANQGPTTARLGNAAAPATPSPEPRPRP